jgi:DNA polymerase II large subunit
MARSTYIYVAFDSEDQFIMAGTVKREVINWIKNNKSVCVHQVARVCDGGEICGYLDLDKELGKGQ